MENKEFIQQQPASIWQHFLKICTIPRPSKKEEKIIAFLSDFAQQLGLHFKKDKAGNVLISKAATLGYEKRPTIILQSHLDMVCEKNSDSKHNFDTDPIEPYTDGEWVKAKGTTLGADCGIGIAAQLAILSAKNIEHGPIECLFTVDEETGLTGAFALERDFLSGSILFNLDSEDEGEIFIGCAGGIDTLATFRTEKQESPKGFFPIEIVISGLLGGHSGDDIDKGHGNAIKILSRFLWNSLQKYDMKLALMEGGNLRNAIPREARAIILVPSALKESVVVDFNIFRTEIFEELQPVETNIKLQLGSTDMPDEILHDQTTKAILSALYTLPNGVMVMSQRMLGMVETSSNLAAIKYYEDTIQVTTSQRSDRESGKNHIASVVSAVFEQAGAKVHQSDGYPGWSPNPNSSTLAVATKLYKEMFKETPVVRSIHAGLECGLFLKKYPNLDMISFGPTIKGAHSPDERLHIGSVQKFWDFLVKLIAITGA